MNCPAVNQAGVNRRRLLLGTLGLALTGCSAGPQLTSPVSNAAAGTHPALRRPRPEGVAAMLTPAGDASAVLAGARELRRRAGSDAMVGVGDVFFEAAGLAARRPAGFGRMPEFPGDVLLPERTGAALVVQVEGDSADAVGRHADDLLDGVPGLRVSWRSAVARSVAGAEQGRPLQRNPFGFVEGQGNPALPADAAGHVLVADGPRWLHGGSYLALRVIRMAHDQWNADGVEKQERIIGRRTDGRWLDGTAPFAEPRFAADPEGAVTPLDSHVRKVNPRTADQPPPRMLRRSWTYGGGTAVGGQPDEGLVFMAFQNDLAAGFLRAQQRLRGEAMAPYLLTVGGGYFAVPTTEGLAALLDA